ncbi:MAG: GGDEF domain-containing protein [Lachnospiraceae bacterium]|nr:GGDEF domain-containing protein [Lachnospiraceae bacterium]
MLREQSVYHKTSLALSIVLIFLVTISAFLYVDRSDFPGFQDELSLTDGWEIFREGGETSRVSLPIDLGHTGESVLTHELPELEDDSILALNYHFETAEAYVDGEKIYTAQPALLGKRQTTLSNSFCLIPLNSSYSGKTITIVTTPRNYAHSIKIKEAVITTMADYSLKRIRLVFPYFFLCALIFMVSVTSLITYLVISLSAGGKEYLGQTMNDEQNAIRQRLGYSFLLLFAFGALTSIYIFSDFHVIGMVENRMAMSGIISYLCFFLIPPVLAALMRTMISDNKPMRILHIVSVANFIIQMSLFLMGLIDLPQGLVITQMLGLILLIVMILTCFVDLKTRGCKNVSGTARILMVISMAVFAGIAIIRYILGKDWMYLVAIAMFLFLIYVLQNLMEELYQMIRFGIRGEQMRIHAYADDLTGLKNRRAYDEEMNELEELPPQAELVYLMMDVNGLKKANDILGHAAGDELLVATAQIIRDVFGQFGNCYRTGGDEFVVIAHGTRSETEDLMRIFLKRTKEWKGKFQQELSVSIGGALQEEHMDLSVDELAKLADSMMYQAKKAYYEQKGIDRRKNRS